ncbi:Kinesin-1-like protein PSS1 [Platanthera guangdongensis]|uniref:Kinesin-1-like protein PSS1 n=1 Tax=Platanthera guangdongensis TaxID=2320717 RepID=A0ABR2MJY7_9ASPA
MESSPAPTTDRNRFTWRKRVRIVGKIRDLTESEKQSYANPPQISIAREDDHVSVIFQDQTNGRRDICILDGFYEQDESTSKLYDHEVKPLLQGLLHGDNCCVVAFGAQGSGKSQLIQGSAETPGLAMMAFCDAFSRIEEFGGSVAISCYEMHNDHIYDLLEYKEQEIQIMENAEKEIWLKGLSKIPVKSISDFVNFYFHISNQQKFPQNAEINVKINSHKGLIMYVTTTDKESKNSIVGKINFMDMAGYQDAQNRVDAKASKSELSKVNKSLYALHNVVSALNGDEPHIPYRESKLTRLLQDFLCSMNNSVLITCLSPTLFPLTSRAISNMASRSCQFFNSQRHDLARSKECMKHFLSRSPIDGTHPLDPITMKQRDYGLGLSENKVKKNASTYKGNALDNTMVKRGMCGVGSSGANVKGNASANKGGTLDNPMLNRGIHGVGSSRTNIKENSSTSKGRDNSMLKRRICRVGSSGINIKENPSTSKGRSQSQVGTVKKAAATPHWTKERKLFNVACPLANTRKLTNWHNKEKESAGSNVISVSSAFKEENSPIDRPTISSTTKKDASESVDQIQNNTDGVLAIDHIQHTDQNVLAIDMPLTLDAEGSPEYCVNNKRSPTLTETLRELSNRFKSLSSQPISSKLDYYSIHEGVVPKTPRLVLSSMVDYNSIPESFATPQEKLKARSAVLKKSLVNECLDFFNSASKEELKHLKGIGEKRASYILELREESPTPFKNIDDLRGLGLSLKQIKGIISDI